MPAILPSVKIDSDSMLTEYFLAHQIAWILGEDELHALGRQVVALAEKSVRIGWTYADAFKNVRKRLRFPNRDYLFATKDYPSALEYMRLALEFARLLNYTRAIVAHGENFLKVNRVGADGQPTPFTEEIQIGYIHFDNGSFIRAFSAHPQAMAVYGGDVGLDEFAKHPNAQLLWQTAQGRVTWANDIAVWSSHEGENTLFNQFAQQARAGKPPWNLYYRVTMPDAIQLGLVDLINRTRGTNLDPGQFIADCRARAGLEEIYEQSYMCNPAPAAATIVDWSAIERCRADYQIERLHLEADQVRQRFGSVTPDNESARTSQIQQFIRGSFPILFGAAENTSPNSPIVPIRLGFDVAASGKGDLAAMYLAEPVGSVLWLRALFTARTDDWHFLKTVLYYFLSHRTKIQGAGDESSLGRQICWEAAQHFPSRFSKVNFGTKKSDLGFSLMNQLSSGENRFPKSHDDIAADFFALRKAFIGGKWVFSETRNSFNPASHCDIAWAGALASHAHSIKRSEAWALAG
jgi:phage FluMu gp28-like protein